MGESSRLETAITVTGLKSCHFYNVRVIAVGSNNFQAGSGVIRLKTYGRDGIPQLTNGRVPSNFVPEDQHNSTVADSSDESPAGRSHGVGIEAAALPEGTNIMARESGNGVSGQRRNTGGRRHSPSNAAADQAAIARARAQEPKESMQELTERFEAIRRETEETAGQIVKDSEEFRSQILDLMKERDEKKQTLKEKEEASEKLKKDVRDSERANRQAQTRKSQKEKTLRDKQAERTRTQDDLVRWRNEIDIMKQEREEWQRKREEIIRNKEADVEGLRGTIRQRQLSVSGWEEEIREKGRKIEDSKKDRENLPGAQDDEESRERDAAERQRDSDWAARERELTAVLSQHTVTLRGIKQDIDTFQTLYQSLTTRQARSPFMYSHGNSSGVDFDPTGSHGTAKPRRSRNRKSRTNTMSSPIAGYPITDSTFPSASAYNNLNSMISPTFAQGPYFDLSNDTAMVPLSEQMSGLSEADIRALTAGAPLSPTATNLLPAELFNDDEPPSPGAGSTRSIGPTPYGSAALLENDPQSPHSSSRSPSLVSSPQNSSYNLAKYGVSGHDYSIDADRHSLNSTGAAFGAIGSPSGSDQAAPPKSFGKNLFNFPRARGKTMQDDGPALGSLKQGQSQSFPRSTEEPESVLNRHRRISFSTSWNMPSFLTRGSAIGEAAQGNGPAPARNAAARRRRGFNMFGSNGDDSTGSFPDRDPSSPRPLSIASSDLPRPSTDSAPFGWPAALDGNTITRNSPLATNWSINVAPTNWSRNPSRRPSLQHGSTTALTGGIACDDDEFLPSESLADQSSPPPVGVIGTRPPSSHKPVTPKLNPAAPTFKLFNLSKGKEKTVEPTTSYQTPKTVSTTSQPESRQSRETPSIYTQNSGMAESHESLDRFSSNSPSERTNPSAASTKEKESSFQKLLRKGSSSKFSLSSIRNKDSGFFGGKKGPASATNSDRADREGSFDEGAEDTGLGRSVDSVISNPVLSFLGSGELKGKDNQAGTPKEGRIIANWGRAFGIKKDKNKGRESLEVESRSETENTGTEDEGP